MAQSSFDPEHLAAAIRAGDRAALARGITLVESDTAEHEQQAAQLLQRLHASSGRSLRVGISGAPGVGKSTFLEAFGMHLLGRGHRVAVLAVDPSSRISGGSILGDKTRMARLAREEGAFIRPSPGGGWSGGVARRTREASRLCEAAGYGIVCIETIGVGQAELAVADLVDCCVLLLLAQGGDELQGIKRGIMEVADIVVIHKADGPLLAAAAQAQAEMAGALRLLRGEAAAPQVLCASSQSGHGIAAVADAVLRFAAPERAAARQARRREQALRWFDEALRDRLLSRLLADPQRARRIQEARAAVAAGSLDALGAAAQVLSVDLPRT